MPYRAGIRVRDKRGNPILTLRPVKKSKSKKAANALARRLASRHLKNVMAGFHDATGFHPIRASADYSPSRAGEKARSRSKKKKGKKGKKRKK